MEISMTESMKILLLNTLNKNNANPRYNVRKMALLYLNNKNTVIWRHRIPLSSAGFFYK